jgi:hypothetical protein
VEGCCVGRLNPPGQSGHGRFQPSRQLLTHSVTSRPSIAELAKGSFDHLVGAHEECFRDSEAKCLGSRGIDDELKLSRFQRATSRNLSKIVQKVAQIVAHGAAATLFVSFTKRPIN